MRSSAKPLQALPLARAYARPRRRATSRSPPPRTSARREQIDGRARAARRDGRRARTSSSAALQEGRPPEPVFHNCSGKHAGMLAALPRARLAGEGYRLPEHPVQRLLLERGRGRRGARPGRDRDRRSTAAASSPSRLPLERVALAFVAARAARRRRPRVAAAMRAHPELIGGAGATDTALMQRATRLGREGRRRGPALRGRPDGIGIALKVEDGSVPRARPALAAFLGRLGLDAAGVRRRSRS